MYIPNRFNNSPRFFRSSSCLPRFLFLESLKSSIQHRILGRGPCLLYKIRTRSELDVLNARNDPSRQFRVTFKKFSKISQNSMSKSILKVGGSGWARNLKYGPPFAVSWAMLLRFLAQPEPPTLRIDFDMKFPTDFGNIFLSDS